MKPLLTLSAAALPLLLATPRAEANCAMPTTYEITVEANTVTVCPSNHDDRACPDEGGMLREAPERAEAVKLADFCEGEGYSGACYLDECVPPGEYRYGFAAPYECCSSCCGTSYFAEVTVTAALPEACERAEGNAAPTPFEGALPWSDDPTICDYDSPEYPDPIEEDAPEADEDGDGSCSVSGNPQRAVLLINGLVLLLGLGGLLRRRA